MMYLRQKAAYCAAFWELTKKPGDSDAWIGFLLRMDFVLGKRPTPYLNTLMAASPMQPRRKENVKPSVSAILFPTVKRTVAPEGTTI